MKRFLLVLCLVLPAAPASAHDLVPQVGRGITLPAGFGFSTFAVTNGLLPTSLTFGPDGRLYVAAIEGVSASGGFGFLARGSVLAFDDLGGIGGPGEVVAGGFDQLLGITFGPDGTLYAADNANNHGRIQALRDSDGDGAYETRRTVLRNIPNGRHQTNGMTFGPDGMLYAANGNATDDGLECGPEPVSSNECPVPERPPWSGSILRVNPSWSDVDLQRDVPSGDPSVLVARGFRNIYDVDFRPGDPTMLYTPMNGSDNPSANEPLYRTDVDDVDAGGAPVIDNAGFPSCLYGAHDNPFPIPLIEGHEHPETFVPEDNPNEDVIAAFGPCPRNDVIRPLMFFAEGHNGTSGMAFERGDGFPDRYDGDLFAAEWGSLWNLNGGKVTGHKIVHIDIGPDGLVERRREFMTGLLPMDITFGPDGAMYVADMQGLVYRVVSVFDTPDVATVEMRAGQFVPQVVFIPRATTVQWVNTDTVPHNVRAEQAVLVTDPEDEPVLQSGSEINSAGNVAPAGSHSHTFGETPGVWKYHSTASVVEDTTMHGAIVVLPVDR